ncbi:hypothetical protein [Sulfurimonas sp.]|uniref:hypothetical protein n=1 Tax=Sulfurimonas sp. TaxID=2022749 RepID=UPI00260B83DE|nr:hypothetical protein [Sulfurimonas sp.]
MIKKIIQLYWYEKTDKTQEHRTFRKSYARFTKHGFRGMHERLNKDYTKIEKDYIVHSQLSKKYSTFVTRLFFLFIFLSAFTYTMFIESELYESQTTLMVRDLSSTPSASTLGLSLLGVGSSSQLQDSMVVKEYLLSLDMFKTLDKKFALIKHYKSDDLDFISRLSSDATLEDALEFYKKRMLVEYDETSALLHISYLHTDPKKAQEILKFTIKAVDDMLNKFNRKKAKKQLAFVELEYKKSKNAMDMAAKALEAYQDKHLLLNPQSNATSSSEIIAGLQSALTQKKIEYKTKSNYLNKNNYELLALKSEIKEIEASIKNAKEALTGKSKNRLNKILFAYNKLKMQFEFSTEVYKNALIQLETTKLEVLKNSKTLSIVTKPNLPDGYTYPKKLKMFITLLIGILLLYGIFSMLVQIIKDHKE